MVLLQGDPDGWRLYYEAMNQWTGTLVRMLDLPKMVDFDRPRLPEQTKPKEPPDARHRLELPGRRNETQPRRLSQRSDRPDVSRTTAFDEPGTAGADTAS